MTVHEDIFSRLSTDPTVGPLVTNGDSPETFRIHPVNMPQDITYPSIRFQDIGNDPIDNLDGESDLEHDTIQFDCLAETFDGVKALSTAVNAALTGSATNFSARRLTRLDLPFESDQEIFRVAMDFSIWY